MTNWKENIYPFKKFTEEITQEWIDCGFDKKETREWLESDLQPTDANFVQWLKNVKKVDAEWFLENGNEQILRDQHQEYLKEKQYCVTNKQTVDENNWTDIHKDFEYLQKLWEKQGFTYEGTKQWIDIGFTPWDYGKIESWKDYGFNFQQTKSWTEKGLTPQESEFAYYLKQNNYQPGQINNLEELRSEFYNWTKTVQGYLDFWYPKNGTCLRKNESDNINNFNKTREQITKLNFEEVSFLEGSLDLTGFTNLEHLHCAQNRITNLDISSCTKLLQLDCALNQLTNLQLNKCANLLALICGSNSFTNANFLFTIPYPEDLVWLDISLCKNFSSQRLSLKQFVNLESFKCFNSQLIDLDLKSMHKFRNIMVK